MDLHCRLDYRSYQMEQWLWRAYGKCGSDIFCPTIYSDDLEWKLELSDGHYLLIPSDRNKINSIIEKEGRLESLGNETGDILNVLDRGFYLEDIFIGLWDRINGVYENSIDYAEIISEMKAQWTMFISSPKDDQSYRAMWESLKSNLITEISHQLKIIEMLEKDRGDAPAKEEDDPDGKWYEWWMRTLTHRIAIDRAKELIRNHQEMIRLIGAAERGATDIFPALENENHWLETWRMDKRAEIERRNREFDALIEEEV